MKNQLLIALFAVFSVGCDCNSYGQEDEDLGVLFAQRRDLILAIDEIQIAMNDGVTGNCWTNEKSVALEISQSVEKYGLRPVVVDRLELNKPGSSSLIVTMTGSRVAQQYGGGICAVALQANLITRLGFSLPFEPDTLIESNIELFSKGAFITGDTNYVNTVVMSNLQEYMSEILIQHSNAKNNDELDWLRNYYNHFME